MSAAPSTAHGQLSSSTAGWLIKQGGSKVERAFAFHFLQPCCNTGLQGGFKTWKKRWFVLSQSELMYYAQPSRRELKGSMVVTDCVVEHVPPTQV
jgi:hypothetical protein